MKKDCKIIIDFDSTFVETEVMDELAALSLRNCPNRDEIVNSVQEITRLGMDGKITFDKSLEQRIALLSTDREEIEELTRNTASRITKSILRNRDFFLANSKNIYIISGGFKDVIVPVVRDFGIRPENVFANTFVFNELGNVIGVDTENFLAQEKGKVKQVKALNLSGSVYIIGDGFTDYQIKEAGLADKFVAFTENIDRPKVTEVADLVVKSFDEFLEKEKIEV
jgi:D-3-phosphoglycerate dehydrogenase